MVRKNEGTDDGREAMLLRKLVPVGNMLYDVPRTLLGRKVLVIAQGPVGGKHRFILHEAHRVQHLSYVVIEGSGPDKLHVGTYGTGHGIGHVHHLE